MKKQIAQFLFLILGMAILVGCGGDKKEETKKDKDGTKQEHSDDDHSHDGEELTWTKKDIEFEGHMISLGHHGEAHFHGGDKIEPAAVVTKDGADVADAKATCSFLDKDGKPMGPANMVFEPKTEAEPAHYAQGELTFPEEEGKYMIEFVITVGDKEFKDSIEVMSGH